MRTGVEGLSRRAVFREDTKQSRSICGQRSVAAHYSLFSRKSSYFRRLSSSIGRRSVPWETILSPLIFDFFKYSPAGGAGVYEYVRRKQYRRRGRIEKNYSEHFGPHGLIRTASIACSRSGRSPEVEGAWARVRCKLSHGQATTESTTGCRCRGVPGGEVNRAGSLTPSLQQTFVYLHFMVYK